jgi:dTDP-4-amino-4,6-dideoxygalactose transaminase
MRVPFVDIAAQEVAVAAEALRAVAEVAKGGQFILGPRVAAFERWLANACGAAHAIGVASGTDALDLALRAVGVAPGDAVVTPAVSFVAAAEVVVRLGAVPVFADVDAQTMNLSASTARDAIAVARGRGLRVKALLPVHLFGLSAPIDLLAELAAEEGAALVEDAAQAIGARDGQGRPPGIVGDAAAFSFFPTKNLGAWGDGGAVVTGRSDVAALVRTLRVHGASAPHVHDAIGSNSRLDEVQAAILLVKTRVLEAWQAARARLATRYLEELARFPLAPPHRPKPPALHGWHAFVVRSERRDALLEWLREHGVDARIYYPRPLHEQACFASLPKVSLPIAEKVCKEAVALPLFPSMSETAQAHVIAQIEAFFAR